MTASKAEAGDESSTKQSSATAEIPRTVTGLRQYSCDVLRDLLKERSLETSGKKADLVTRLKSWLQMLDMGVIEDPLLLDDGADEKAASSEREDEGEEEDVDEIDRIKEFEGLDEDETPVEGGAAAAAEEVIEEKEEKEVKEEEGPADATEAAAGGAEEPPAATAAPEESGSGARDAQGAGGAPLEGGAAEEGAPAEESEGGAVPGLKKGKRKRKAKSVDILIGEDGQVLAPGVVRKNNGVTEFNSARAEAAKSGAQSPSAVKRQRAAEMNTEVFVGGISRSITVEQLRETFAPFGRVEHVRIITDRATGKGKGFGFVRFEEKGSCERAIEALHNTDYMGRLISVRLSAGTRDAAPAPPGLAPLPTAAAPALDPEEARFSTIHVTGLGPEITEDQIAKHFAVFGPVVDVRLAEHLTKGRRRDFAFVEYGAPRGAQAARDAILNLSETTFCGRPIRVSLAKSAHKQDSRSRFGTMYGRGAAPHPHPLHAPHLPPHAAPHPQHVPRGAPHVHRGMPPHMPPHHHPGMPPQQLPPHVAPQSQGPVHAQMPHPAAAAPHAQMPGAPPAQMQQPYAAAPYAPPHMQQPHMQQPHMQQPHMQQPQHMQQHMQQQHMQQQHMQQPHMQQPHMQQPHMQQPHMQQPQQQPHQQPHQQAHQQPQQQPQHMQPPQPQPQMQQAAQHYQIRDPRQQHRTAHQPGSQLAQPYGQPPQQPPQQPQPQPQQQQPMSAAYDPMAPVAQQAPPQQMLYQAPPQGQAPNAQAPYHSQHYPQQQQPPPGAAPNGVGHYGGQRYA